MFPIQILASLVLFLQPLLSVLFPDWPFLTFSFSFVSYTFSGEAPFVSAHWKLFLFFHSVSQVLLGEAKSFQAEYVYLLYPLHPTQFCFMLVPFWYEFLVMVSNCIFCAYEENKLCRPNSSLKWNNDKNPLTSVMGVYVAVCVCVCFYAATGMNRQQRIHSAMDIINGIC